MLIDGQLRNVIKESELDAELSGGLQLFMPPGEDCLFPIASPRTTNPKGKTWVPAQECQFKCCHSCRPNGADRSWISLDAVVNGDLPLTAVSGFGFHYYGKRPVALVELVRNIGLREGPELKPGSVSGHYFTFVDFEVN